MTAPQENPRFRGSFSVLTKQMGVAAGILGFALCSALFGPVGFRLFLVTLAVFPLIGLVALLVSYADQLEFDDRYACIRRRFRRPLNYADIKLVRLSMFMGLAQAVARTREGDTQVLLISLSSRDGKAFRHVLRERCEGTAIRKVRHSGTKWMAAVLGFVVVGYAVATFVIQQRYPVANADCEPVFVDTADSGQRSVMAAGLLVSFPQHLVSVPQTGLGAVLWDPDTDLTINLAIPEHDRMLGRSGRLFLAASGIRGEYELFRYACCSSYGGVPLLLKSFLLSHWRNPRVLEWSAGNSRGIFFGSITGRVDARLLVFDRDRGEELYGLVTSPREVAIQHLGETLRLISIASQ